MKFVIVSPRDAGGGALALRTLCYELNMLGHDAKIYYVQGDNHKGNRHFWIKQIGYWITDSEKLVLHRLSKALFGEKHSLYQQYCYNPVPGERRKWLPFISSNTVVLYPEIFKGNFLHAKNTVHWFLYFNRYKNDETAYQKKDLFFCYRKIFNDYSLNPDGKTMIFNFFDSQTYRQYNTQPRKGCCYIIRKGRRREDCPKSYKGPVIDAWTESEKVKAFNTYQYCYFYDTQTFYTNVAAVCGCIPIVVLEPGKVKEDYLGKGDEALGVAYGDTPEEIAYALKTRGDVMDRIRQFDMKNRENAQYFVDTCREYFKIKDNKI